LDSSYRNLSSGYISDLLGKPYRKQWVLFRDNLISAYPSELYPRGANRAESVFVVILHLSVGPISSRVA